MEPQREIATVEIVSTGIDKSDLVHIGKDLVASDLGGETVLFDLNRSFYYGLNRVAARVWEHLSEPRSAGEVLDRLRAEFDVDPSEAWSDLRDLLAEMAEKGLIEIDHAPSR
jgi:hypothetical protein